MVVLLCSLVCCGMCYDQLQLQQEWLSWKRQHYKVYSSSEEGSRWMVWRENYHKIQQHNKANHSFVLGLNSFADLVSGSCKTSYP